MKTTFATKEETEKELNKTKKKLMDFRTSYNQTERLQRYAESLLKDLKKFERAGI